MDVATLDLQAIRRILRTSEGFPSQDPGWKAKVVGEDAKTLVTTNPAHALRSHLSGAGRGAARLKSKFRKFDEMVQAFYLYINTPQVKNRLKDLRPGHRLEPRTWSGMESRVGNVFDVEVLVTDESTPPTERHPDWRLYRDLGRQSFSKQDLRRAGIHGLLCHAVLEGRQRGNTVHLHVVTFYPVLTFSEMVHVLDVKTAPPTAR